MFSWRDGWWCSCCHCFGHGRNKALRSEHSSSTSLDSSKSSKRSKSSFRFARFLRNLLSRKGNKFENAKEDEEYGEEKTGVDSMGARLGRTDKITSSDNALAGSGPTKTLSEHEIQLLLSNTTMSREQIIDFHRNFLQDCPNGCLTRKEFLKMFKEIHPVDKSKQKADKFSDYVFRALDVDSNNVIEFTDFVVCFSITSFGNLNEKISLAFKIYDLDKNNVIDKSEMLKVLEALYDLTGIGESDRKGDQAPKAKVEAIMKKLDKNRDSVIQFDEFLEGCMQDEFVRKILIDPMFNC